MCRPTRIELIKSIQNHIDNTEGLKSSILMVNGSIHIDPSNPEYVFNITNEKGDFCFGEIRVNLRNYDKDRD